MMIYQEKIAQPGPLPAANEPADVLHLQRTIDSLEQENAWLREQLRARYHRQVRALSWRPLSFGARRSPAESRLIRPVSALRSTRRRMGDRSRPRLSAIVLERLNKHLLISPSETNCGTLV